MGAVLDSIVGKKELDMTEYQLLWFTVSSVVNQNLHTQNKTVTCHIMLFSTSMLMSFLVLVVAECYLVLVGGKNDIRVHIICQQPDKTQFEQLKCWTTDQQSTTLLNSQWILNGQKRTITTVSSHNLQQYSRFYVF